MSQNNIINQNQNENQSRFHKYLNNGFTGLANCGNTCYINSCMQILSHTYELNDMLDLYDETKLNNNVDSIFLKQWNILRKMIWDKNCVIAPMGFLKTLFAIAKHKQRDLFAGFQQNDVQEYLLFVIECFHNSMSKKVNMEISGHIKNDKDKIAIECYKMYKNMFEKDYSNCIEIFYGLQISQIKDIHTKEILRNIPEPFSVLSIPVTENTNDVYDCMNTYCETEILKDDNAWYNEKTKEKIAVEKQIVFWNLPNILIISLKRWNSQGRKINKIITSPVEDIDFSNYVHGYNKEAYRYDLYGICNHSGNVFGGHYTAYVKHANGKWYEFNDTQIREANTNELFSSRTYCLFYRKR